MNQMRILGISLVSLFLCASSAEKEHSIDRAARAAHSSASFDAISSSTTDVMVVEEIGRCRALPQSERDSCGIAALERSANIAGTKWQKLRGRVFALEFLLEVYSRDRRASEGEDVLDELQRAATELQGIPVGEMFLSDRDVLELSGQFFFDIGELEQSANAYRNLIAEVRLVQSPQLVEVLHPKSMLLKIYTKQKNYAEARVIGREVFRELDLYFQYDRQLFTECAEAYFEALNGLGDRSELEAARAHFQAISVERHDLNPAKK